MNHEVSAGRDDPEVVSDFYAARIPLESFTQQHMADEVNINTIVRRFGVTGQLPQGVRQGVYGDFTQVSNYREAMEMIQRTNEEFMALPPAVREKFGNDPARVVDLAQMLPEKEFFDALEFTAVPAVAEPPVVGVVPVAAPPVSPAPGV